mmetsp:Transcript_27959/g.52446  ORF Transcript_27959/g.52446 Transcript_27959/m.52446 type:complete len:221 (-) Transcript_27959:739-1401(-)
MPSMLVEGTPLVKDVKDEVMNETIRGVEMLRHLSVAVCQFDLSGRVMFQNPIAIPAQVEDENEANVESNGTTKSHKDSDAKGSTSNPANREDSSINRGNIRRSGDFVDRFVDPNLGRQLLEKLQSAQQETEQEVDLEAEIQTNNGPRWNAIQLRKTLDREAAEIVCPWTPDSDLRCFGLLQTGGRENASGIHTVRAEKCLRGNIRSSSCQLRRKGDILDI